MKKHEENVIHYEWGAVLLKTYERYGTHVTLREGEGAHVAFFSSKPMIRAVNPFFITFCLIFL